MADLAGDASPAPAQAPALDGLRRGLPLRRRPRRTPGGSAHVQVVDGLRGLAILLVLLFHYWQLSFWVIPIPGLPAEDNLEFIQVAGGLGVELFFFISAFCLFYPHAKAMFGQGPVPKLKHFYYRRFIKIVPSYVLAMVVLGFGFASLYPVTWKYGTWADIGLHAVFLHNLTPDTRSSFDSVLWSLAVEVQFYYIFPLIARYFRRQPWLTAAAMIGVALIYRAWTRHKGLDVFEQWDNQLPGFLDLFASGMLSAYLLVWVRQRPRAARQMRYLFTALALVSFAVLLLMFRWIYDNRFDGNSSSIWKSDNRQWLGLLFVCITVASTYSITFWRRVLANRVLLFLSTISYNLYIWHQTVGVLIRDRHWYKARTEPPMADPHWRVPYLIIAVGSSILLASAITYGFERPLLRLGIRGALRALATKLSLLAAAAASSPPPPEATTASAAPEPTPAPTADPLVTPALTGEA